MAAPVQYKILPSEASCMASSCEGDSGPYVVHTHGNTHPMHLECALRAFDATGKCSYCSRPVDGEALRLLAARLEPVESKNLDAPEEMKAEMKRPDTSHDEGVARDLQRELDEQARLEAFARSFQEPDPRLDAEYARQLEDQERQSLRRRQGPDTSNDEVVARLLAGRSNQRVAAPTPTRNTCAEMGKVALLITVAAFAVGFYHNM